MTAGPDPAVDDSSTTFDSLGLDPALRRAVDEVGWTTPTPIQSAAIPAALGGRDVLGAAQTGSGKTAAFALPVLHRLARVLRGHPRRVHALVLVPTRELADQVAGTFRTLARHVADPVKVVAAFGGVSINPQMMELRGGADVVVATPGRLLDLVQHNALRLEHVATLVLDEADRLLDAGFADELGRVLSLLPPRRQSLLFSATFPPAVQDLVDQQLRDPVRVDVTTGEAAAPAPDIAQRAIEVDAARRTPLLRQLLRESGWGRVLVFVATRYACDHVAEKLRQAGIAAAAFHGERSQGARSQALWDLKEGRVQVLVATDVAARGIDIADLDVVVNYDLPRSAADHVHRIGRTARAGASGLAVSFVHPLAEGHFRLIEKRQGRRVPRERVPGFEPREAAPAADPASSGPAPLAAPDGGGIKGRRKSKKDKLRELKARSG
jgi:superfamily II DNA/RNA helicase